MKMNKAIGPQIKEYNSMIKMLELEKACASIVSKNYNFPQYCIPIKNTNSKPSQKELNFLAYDLLYELSIYRFNNKMIGNWSYQQEEKYWSLCPFDYYEEFKKLYLKQFCEEKHKTLFKECYESDYIPETSIC